jgi:hypothetical protein
MTMLSLIFAQSAPEHSGVTIGMSLVVLGGGAIWYCIKHRGAQWPFGLLCVVVGVIGSTTIIGTMSWALVDIVVSVFNEVGAAISKKAGGA